MKLDVVGLITVLASVATALFTLLHGKDDGRLVRDLAHSIDEQKALTSNVTSDLSQAYKETREQLGRLIDVLVERLPGPQ